MGSEYRGHTKCFQSTYAIYSTLKSRHILPLLKKTSSKVRCFHLNQKKNRMCPYTQTRRTKQELSKWTELVVEHWRSQANNFQGYLCHEDILISLKPACVPIASIIKHNYWQACSVAGFEGKPNSREDTKLRFNCLHSNLLWDWSLNKKRKSSIFCSFLWYLTIFAYLFCSSVRFLPPAPRDTATSRAMHQFS